MKGKSFSASTWLAVAVLALAAGQTLNAGGVVTDCSEAELLSALSGGGIVTFASDCSITLSQPLYIPAGTTTIDAAGHTVTLNGGGTTRMFNVSGDLTLLGLTLSNGHEAYGGAIYISAMGSVFASNCVFTGNVAVGTNGVAGTAGADSSNGAGGSGTSGTDGTAGIGGAVFNDGILTVSRCTFATNSATGGSGGAGGAGGAGGGTFGQGGDGGNGGAGAAAWGGAVFNRQNLTVVDSTFSGNIVTGGAGASGGASGSGNYAGKTGNGGSGGIASGAGIYNGKYLVVRNSTFSSNRAVGGASAAGGSQNNGSGTAGPNGGGAEGGGLSSTLWGVATNCTFYGDSVAGGTGGNGGPAIGTLGQAGDGGDGGNGEGGAIFNTNTFIIENCTIAKCSAVGGTNGVAGTGNFAGVNGQPGLSAGGGLANVGTFTLINSLLSTNTPGGNGNGLFRDAGHNLSSDASIAFSLASSHAQTNPRLGSLANYGGPTLTMALLSGSPAIDAIATTQAFPSTDQRGVGRPLGSGADIGAYEYGTNTFVAPMITTRLPSTLSVVRGQSITMNVVATGDSLAYQWSFQSNALAGATTSSYTVNNAQLTNAGTYKVVVSNQAGSSSSSTILKVLVPTTISQASVVSNQFRLTYPTQVNLSYVLQYKNSLNDTSWTGLMNTLGTGAMVTNFDPLTNSPSRFYRILVK